jgi:hypothetical protein
MAWAVELLEYLSVMRRSVNEAKPTGAFREAGKLPCFTCDATASPGRERGLASLFRNKRSANGD